MSEIERPAVKADRPIPPTKLTAMPAKKGALLQLAIGTVQTRYLHTRHLESRGFPAFLGLTFD
jgi:hypothetical protein